MENGEKYGSTRKMHLLSGSLRRNKKQKAPSLSSSSFTVSPQDPPFQNGSNGSTSPRSPLAAAVVTLPFDITTAVGAHGDESDKSSDKSSLSEHSPGIATKKDSYVGFANLPNQVFRKSVKKGFQFTLMVVGESGLGKSTLINSLFLTDLYVNSEYDDAAAKVGKTMSVNASTFEMKEGKISS